jgi:uncharacterized protein
MIRAVIDTNLLVSATLKNTSIPGLILDAVRQRQVVPVYSIEILREYREVLSRPKFGFSAQEVHRLIDDIAGLGKQVYLSGQPPDGLPDPKDWPVIAAALAGGCLIVSGNIRHFLPDTGVIALTPREFFEHFLRVR